jgi:hypothetical protein
MSHVTAHPGWADVDVNVETANIFCQQRWRYTWLVVAPASTWTLRERRRFHQTLDRQIWGRWSVGVRLNVRGNHAFARRHSTARVSFDVRWSLSNQHWDVSVRKLPAGSDPTTFISNVHFGRRQIELDSADVRSYRPQNAAGARREFEALPHEFGHTMDNPDEYVAGSGELADTDSIMNIGRRIRARHLQLLITVLEGALPGCTFTAA